MISRHDQQVIEDYQWVINARGGRDQNARHILEATFCPPMHLLAGHKDFQMSTIYQTKRETWPMRLLAGHKDFQCSRSTGQRERHGLCVCASSTRRRERQTRDTDQLVRFTPLWLLVNCEDMYGVMRCEIIGFRTQDIVLVVYNLHLGQGNNK